MEEFIEIFPIDKLKLIFIICDILEFEFIEKNITDNFNKFSYKFQPFYTGDNIDFFKDSVFLEMDDIFVKKFKLKDLLSKTILNLNNFGKLTLLYNDLIYSNINESELGDVNKLDFNYLIRKALSNSNFGWIQSRCKVEPCSACQYNAFCPPISNYEYAIGKYNLCHVWEEN